MNDQSDDDRRRDSLLLLAEISANGEQWVAKIRNISVGGLMAEPCGDLDQGARVAIELPNLGTVEGKVAWVSAPRFGVVFDEQVDPRAVRGSVPSVSTAVPGDPQAQLRRI